MQNEADFARLYSDYQATYGYELQAKVARLDGIIGRSHWLSVGAYKEELVRSILANRLPKRFEISTGFVLAHQDNVPVRSKQLDLLVWDSHSKPPFFRDGPFVIVPPEALVAAVEIKSRLDSGKLTAAMENLDSLMAFNSFFGENQLVHRSVFAFESSLAFPTAVFDSIHRYYSQSADIPLERRIEESWQMHPRPRWSLPWIDNIAILGAGVINCQSWIVNDLHAVSHVAYSTAPPEDDIDAYGFLERNLLMDLLLDYNELEPFDRLPGYASAVFTDKVNMVAENAFIVYPELQVTKIGGMEGKENEEWVAKAYYAKALQ